MSGLSKAVVSGKVLRNPEKRFTNNDFPITSFTIDFSNNEKDQYPKLLKVLAMGKLAENAEEIVTKDSHVIVEGTIQTAAYPNEKGVEKKVIELVASSIAKLDGNIVLTNTEFSGSTGSSQPAKKVSAQTSADSDLMEEFDNFVTADDLIGDDEIPF